jgi:putative membrane protein
MNSLKLVSLALCLGGLLSACAAAERAMPGTLSDANVVSVLDAIDVTEIEAAQLAKQKASNPAVRAYASRLVDEHTANMQQTLQLANRRGLQPDKPRLAAAVETTHQKTMDELRKKSGRDFDRAYLDYQVTMHQQAIQLVQDTANSVEDTRLKQHLIQTRPDLMSHLTGARDLQRQLVAQY